MYKKSSGNFVEKIQFLVYTGLVRNPMIPLRSLRVFQGKALQKLSSIWKVFGKLKFPNTSTMLEVKKCGKNFVKKTEF